MDLKVMISLLVVFAGSLCQAFTVDHVNFIQAEGGNFLFRGGLPDDSGQFQYTQLVTQLAQVAIQQGGVSLPDQFYLIDINLLNPNDSGDEADIKMEESYFASNSKQGYVLQHPIYGEETNPFNFSSSYVQQKALTFASWSTDNLPAFIEQIRGIVLQKNSTAGPTVSYIHCVCGCDRTGEISGSYYMAYMNMSLHDAHQLDMKIAGREITAENHYALNWYCFYLKYAKGYDLTCEP